MFLNPPELLRYLYGCDICPYSYTATTLPMHLFLMDQITVAQSIQKSPRS